MIKQKRATWKAFKCFRSVDCLSAFRAIRNKVCSALRTAEKQYLLSLHRDIRTVNRSDSVKKFWSYIKRVTGRIKASTIPDLEVTHPQDGSSDTITTDAGKASTLNSFFVQQTCLHDPPQSFPVLPAASQESPSRSPQAPARCIISCPTSSQGKRLDWMACRQLYCACVRLGFQRVCRPCLTEVLPREPCQEHGRRLSWSQCTKGAVSPSLPTIDQ